MQKRRLEKGGKAAGKNGTKANALAGDSEKKKGKKYSCISSKHNFSEKTCNFFSKSS